MTSAWELLLSGSTIVNGDAWEHMNAQGGSSSYTILADGIAVDVGEDYAVEVDMTEIVVAVSTPMIEVMVLPVAP